MRPEPKLSRGTSMTSTARRGIALLAVSLDRTSHTNRDIWFTSKWDELLFSSSSLASVAVSVRSRLTQTIDYCSTCVVDVVDVTCCLHVRVEDIPCCSSRIWIVSFIYEIGVLINKHSLHPSWVDMRCHLSPSSFPEGASQIVHFLSDSIIEFYRDTGFVSLLRQRATYRVSFQTKFEVGQDCWRRWNRVGDITHFLIYVQLMGTWDIRIACDTFCENVN